MRIRSRYQERYAGANRKVKGTIHWVSCATTVCEAEVRLYDRLWKVENPRDEIGCHPRSKELRRTGSHERNDQPRFTECIANCYVEKFLPMPSRCYLQFQRIGYFNVDKDSTPENLIFNRTVSLKDTWSKINK